MSDTSALMEALKNAKPEDLAQIDKEIAELEGKLTGLRALKRVLDVAMNGHPITRHKRASLARAAVAQPATNGTGAGKAADDDDDDDDDEDTGSTANTAARGSVRHQHRLAAARILLHGPLRQVEIANRGEIPAGSITAVLEYEWFRKEQNGLVGITAAGRTAVTGKQAIP